MFSRTLSLVALTSAPLFAQATWTASPITPAEQVHRPSAALGDVDGDGIADLVLGRNGEIVVRRGTRGAPDRQFAAVEQQLPARPGPMLLQVTVGPSCESAGQPRLADVDHDGDLDVVAIDSELGAKQRIVWFTNDSRGTFAPAQELTAAGGQRFTIRGDLRAVDLADVDRDGHLDLLVATHELRLHRGGAAGFAAEGRDLGMKNRGAAVLADWDGDAAIDLLYVGESSVMLRRNTGDRFTPPERLADVEGDASQVQLAAADWDGDGRADLLLGEMLPQRIAAADPASAAEAEARRRAAQRVLDVVQQELARLNASKPPFGDAAAMASRDAWRNQLGHWAEGPRALLEAPQRQATVPSGRLRALVRR